MKTQSTSILKVLNVLSYITFLALCVKAGVLLCFYFISMYINEAGAKFLQLGLDLSLLKAYDETIAKLIKKMSIFSLLIGLLSNVTEGYVSKFIAMKIVPNLIEHIGLGDAFLFFARILYFISLLFDKGIELQRESELTV
jgi:hypothetical protein